MHTGAIYNAKGIDIKAADQHVAKKGNLRGFMEADRVSIRTSC